VEAAQTVAMSRTLVQKSPSAAATADASLTALLLRLWRHLSERRRRQFMMHMGLMVLSVIAELVSLGAVLPFIAVLASPERAFRHRLIADLAQSWGIDSPNELVLPLTIAFACAALLAGAVRMLVVWVNTRFTATTGAELSLEIYRRTLYQPYRVHIGRSSSEVISGIANKVGATMLGVLLPGVTLISSTMLLLAMVITLLLIDPLAATVAAVGFGASYGLITWAARRGLRRNSQLIAAEQTQVVKALQEGLGGIRDVLLDGTQQVYCDVYKRADWLLRRVQGNNIFIQQSPRYLMEAMGMILIAALAYTLSTRSGGIATALPVLGALALGANRMLPALQQSYASWASIAGSHGTLADTIDLLDQPIRPELLEPVREPLVLRESVRFRNVRFRYSGNGPWVLDDFDLTIPKGARIGFVGGTGAGKSTAMDLLMGLLDPVEGQICVDGEPVTGNRVRAWQRAVAHVPQAIYLADATIAENIAFGVPRAAIDMQRVRTAAQRAHIADFIEAAPEGYDALVGERGVRLSGGQRQRIGIARALYKQASVLVLDEATSALDNLTERSVMEAIQALDRELTILLVAHRLTTVRRCDRIVQLEHGRVVAQGSYEELLERSASFRRMVEGSSSVHG
jgi:ATP-binding cassette subfamily B protein